MRIEGTNDIALQDYCINIQKGRMVFEGLSLVGTDTYPIGAGY